MGPLCVETVSGAIGGPTMCPGCGSKLKPFWVYNRWTQDAPAAMRLLAPTVCLNRVGLKSMGRPMDARNCRADDAPTMRPL